MAKFGYFLVTYRMPTLRVAGFGEPGAGWAAWQVSGERNWPNHQILFTLRTYAVERY